MFVGGRSNVGVDPDVHGAELASQARVFGWPQHGPRFTAAGAPDIAAAVPLPPVPERLDVQRPRDGALVWPQLKRTMVLQLEDRLDERARKVLSCL